MPMNFRQTWQGILEATERVAPEGSPIRKLLQIIAILLILEGIAVIILTSYWGVTLGIVSMFVGAILLAIFPPQLSRLGIDQPSGGVAEKTPTYGIRMVDSFVGVIGGSYVVAILGFIVIVLVILFNAYSSPRPDYGDLDSLTLVLGCVMIAYPFVSEKFKVESAFTLIFIGLVVVFLVVPQALMYLGSDGESQIANQYVHYMLAEPFAGLLNLIGIHASAADEFVTFTLQDGTVQTVGISAGCAGLYSFSIFVSAFVAFVLVFERLSSGMTALVLGLGLLVAYLGNLFRMVVIGVVGYYDGMDAFVWAHKNVGWMIFLAWSAVFWFVVMRYADRRSKSSGLSRQSV